MKWRVIAPDDIASREWDGELVVYNDATGHTHHLAPIGGKVLLALLGSSAGSEAFELTQGIAAALEIKDIDVLVPAVEEALHELEALGLASASSA